MSTITQAERIIDDALCLMVKKNADYGDSWRSMRMSSITDQILVKIERVRTIEESGDEPSVSEGVAAEYMDILNYCVFALIKIDEAQTYAEACVPDTTCNEAQYTWTTKS